MAKFGWQQYYRPLPKPLTSLLTHLKIFIASMAGAAYWQENTKIAVWFLAAGGVIDFIVNFFGEAPEVTLEKTAERLQRDKPVDVTVLVEEAPNGEENN